MIEIKKNSVVLFQGDSVTDCGRSREDDSYLGTSYVPLVNDYLKNYGIKVINRSVGGAKINDLLDRFEKDFKEVKPDYIFILIGVNDTWHDFPNQKKTSVFKQQYHELLERIKKEINVPVIIMEPFIIGYKQEITCMRKDLLDKVDELRKLAKEFGTEYITFENDFAEKLIHEDENLYSMEGIHPKELGYKLMASKIINRIKIV